MPEKEKEINPELSLKVSSGLILGTILLLTITLASPKAFKFLFASMAATTAVCSLVLTTKAIPIAEDDGAELDAIFTVREARRLNTIEDIEASNDDDREVRQYERMMRVKDQSLKLAAPHILSHYRQTEVLDALIPPPPPPPSLAQATVSGSVRKMVDSSDISVSFFDWVDLRDCDKYSMVTVFGSPGTGKSKLVKWLAKHVLGADLRAFDVFGRKGEWKGAKRFSKYSDILDEMTQDVEDIERDRYCYAEEDKENFPARVVVLEEGVVTVPKLKSIARRRSKKKNTKKPENYDYEADNEDEDEDDVVTTWVELYSTFTRKLNRRLFLVSVDMKAQDYLSAEHRNRSFVIFPGEKGIREAMREVSFFKLGTQANAKLRHALNEKMVGLQNPCLIFTSGIWMLAECPHLSKAGDPIPFAWDDPRLLMPPNFPDVVEPTPTPAAEPTRMSKIPAPKGQSIEDQRIWLESLLSEEEEEDEDDD